MNTEQDQQQMSEAEREERLEALSNTIVQMRSEAVSARKSSGVEDIWMACEEAYLGIDDLNRGEFSNAKWAKPTSMQGPVTTNSIRGDSKRSTIFIPLTRRYVDAASAKLAEIILPIDDKAFSIKPEPIPDGLTDSTDPAISQSTGQPVMGPNGPVTVGQMEKSKFDAAADSAKKAETRIYDWMVEANYPAEARKLIHDSARIGTGVLKAPFPEMRRDRALQMNGDVAQIVIKETIRPGIKWVDPWNLFPADGCGENIHDGDYCLERDFLSERKLRQLKRNPIYLKDQIDKVIQEGPGKIYMEGGNTSTKSSKKAYEIWYAYCTIKREDLSLTGAAGLSGIAEDKDEIPAICMLVNDTVIGAVINPMDSGAFPYRVKPWSRRIGSWAGIGVAEQGSTPQKVVNGASRALMNNGGTSAGVQFVLDQIGIVPADNNWDITPNKVWYKTGESNAGSVRDAFQVFQIPSVQPQMQAIINYGMQLMEEATGIPLVTQGYQGPTSPETFGQAQLQDNNSHTWIRSIGYSYDDQITEPLVKDLYEWLLLDPDVPNDEKGQFRIDAKGSVAMVERAIQEQTLVMLLGASNNPAFDLDAAKLMQMVLRSKRFDPREVTLSEEDKQKRQQGQMPPPQVAVAQINAQSRLQQTQMTLAQKDKEAQLDNQTEQVRIKTDTDRDTQFVISQERRDNTAMQGRMEELRVKRELAMLEYSVKHQLTLEQTKAQLASVAMTEQTKREIANAQIALSQSESHKDRSADMEKHIATISADQSVLEPPGRAENGKAFTQ